MLLQEVVNDKFYSGSSAYTSSNSAATTFNNAVTCGSNTLTCEILTCTTGTFNGSAIATAATLAGCLKQAVTMCPVYYNTGSNMFLACDSANNCYIDCRANDTGAGNTDIRIQAFGATSGSNFNYRLFWCLCKFMRAYEHTYFYLWSCECFWSYHFSSLYPTGY